MVLKETLAYYTVDDGEAFCTFLDAKKAFDRVDYCKLFPELMKRDIHPLYLRLMSYMPIVMYVLVGIGMVATFRAIDGVKQGGIIIPALFCVYLDSLLLALSRTRVGCFIGDIYVGALAYAGDVTLIAPTARTMRYMLHVCEDISREFCVTFNAAKSPCVVVSTKPERYSESMEFSINCKKIVFSDEYVHIFIRKHNYKEYR